MCSLDPEILRCREEFAEIEQEEGRLELEDWDIQRQIQDLFDDVRQRRKDLVRNRYSRAVFRCYAPKKPRLIRIRTGEKVGWTEAFGDDFEKTTAEQREALVGLIEREAEHREYRFRFIIIPMSERERTLKKARRKSEKWRRKSS
jgi:hypothetical protein